MRRKITIKVSLPLNISNKEYSLFKKKSCYSCPELFVRTYSNVFVSHEGLCLKYGRLLPFSSFNMCTRYDKSFGWNYYKLIMEQYFVSTFGKSLKKYKLNSNTVYAVVHTKWFNYSFWLTSSLVRLQMLVESGIDFVLIYPESWDKISYISQSLQVFPDIKTLKIKDGIHIQIPKLLFPEVRPYTACFSGMELKKIRETIIQKLPEKFITKIFPERIYLTRSKAKCRKIQNENEIIKILIQYKFTIVDFDELSFWEQVACMNNVKNFVSIHGAGMSNIIFMKQGTKVLELINKQYAEKEYTFPFWKMASLLDLKYYMQFGNTVTKTNKLIKGCNSTNYNYSDFLVNQNIYIDINEFEKNLQLILNK